MRDMIVSGKRSSRDLLIGIIIFCNHSISFKECWKYNGSRMNYRKFWKNRDLARYGANSTGFSWIRLLLFLLSIAFDVIVLLTIILLIIGRIGHVPGIILLVVAIGCSLLGKSLWRRSIANIGALAVLFIVFVLLAITICAYVGIEPLASLKNSLVIGASEFGSWVWGKVLLAAEFFRSLLNE